jgi:hypothetical protein
MPGGDARPCRPWLRFYSATADAGSVAPWADSRAARSLTNRRPVPGRAGRLSAAPLVSPSLSRGRRKLAIGVQHLANVGDTLDVQP